jgi:hypothetical protein
MVLILCYFQEAQNGAQNDVSACTHVSSPNPDIGFWLDFISGTAVETERLYSVVSIPASFL